MTMVRNVVSTARDNSVPRIGEIYQVVRWISKTNTSAPSANIFSVFDVNQHLNELCSNGFELLNTHYLGENTEAYGVLYILVRRY